MSLTDYTRLISQLIVSNRTSKFDEAAILQERANEIYTGLNEADKAKSKSIVAMLTMYHNN
jgi:hypothetical protein